MAITVVNTQQMLFNLIFNVAKYYHLAKTQRIPVISPGLIQFRKGFWVGL